MAKTSLPVFIPYDLGVTSTDKNVYLFGNLMNFPDKPLYISKSSNGIGFKPIKRDAIFDDNTFFSKDFRISKINKDYYLLYKQLSDNYKSIKLARSKNLSSWNTLGEIKIINETVSLVPEIKSKDRFIAYYGEKDINVAYSKDLINWENHTKVLSPQNNYFDRYPLKVGNVFLVKEGILVFYFVREYFREGLVYSVGIALFDKDNPERLISRSQKPLCTQQLEAEKGELYPLGIVEFKENLYIYFGIRGKSIYAISYGKFKDVLDELPGRTKPRLNKYEGNPIITPVLEHSWQSDATFNPAAFDDGEGVHFIYRAMGKTNTSVLGYAKSSNGLEVDYRSKEPIYVPRKHFEVPGGSAKAWFMSGGGYGGCEDPRVTYLKDDKKYYLTYVAYNGANAPRIALSSISEEDFKNKNWTWKSPKLISSPNVVNKNAVIFPEKINGKYAIAHRVFPNILLDLLDDLEFKKSRYLKGEYKITPTADGWDSRKIGAGPPPIKTKDGWLLIYHAVDDRNDSQYKIGAMLLDLKEPWKVLYRTVQPILEPDMWYENEGFKSGVAYPCGAVIRQNNLFVYYGGADKFICVASKNLEEFINELKTHHPIKMKKNIIPRTVIQHYA